MTGSKSPFDPAPEGHRRMGRVRVTGLAAALIAAALVIVAGGSLPGQRLFDYFQTISPRRIDRTRVEVVLIDPPSVAAVGAWPWPRYTLARLVENIGRGGAKAIGFDATFPEADRYNPDHIVSLYPEIGEAARADFARLESMDAVFADVIGRHPVVLPRVGVRSTSYDYSSATGRGPDTLPVFAAFAPAPPAGLLAFPRAIVNIPALDEVAAGQALMNGDPDEDGVVRRVPLIATVAGVPTPGLALELARVGQGIETIEPVISGGVLRAVKLGGRTLPVDPQGRMALRMGDFPLAATTSAVNVLRKGLPPDTFRDKIVLIGFTTAGTSDVVTTPVDARTFGGYVQAQAIDTILRGDALARPPWARWAEWVLAAAMALLALFVFPRLRRSWVAIVPAALAILLLGGSWAAFAGANLLLDPVPPLAIGAAAGVAVLVMLFGESSRLQRRLQATLQEERVAGAKAAGELDAAREIQLGMLPPREALGRLHPALDLDALIEPARTVGGDFFDAMRLDANRVCFLVGDVTGKGVPAALFMALSKALSKSVLLRERGDLGEAVTALNAEIARDNAQDMFVTMLVGVIDLASGRIELCNAGHENPLRIDAGGAVSEIALVGGPPLCVADGFPYEAEAIQLSPGEGVAIVTDGITEAQDPAGDFFGHARLAAVLERWRGPASEAGDTLLASVRAFEAGGEPSDDVTVMALRWRGMR